MGERKPKAFSPFHTRWLLNLYPPFLVQGIRVARLSTDFRRATIRVRRGLLTRNLNGSVFGGTIYAAADPIYAVMYWQVMAHRGIRAQAWLKSATVRYLRPATTSLTYAFELQDEDVEQAVEALAREGRFARSHRVEAVDRQGQVCAVLDTEVVLRRPREDQRGTSAF
jgi:acyl-coenzyme A thioesterase PaaI-like protein